MASLEFDSEVNALYLKLRKGKITYSEPLADNIIVDLDDNAKVIGLELLIPPTVSQVTAQFAPVSSSRRQRK